MNINWFLVCFQTVGMACNIAGGRYLGEYNNFEYHRQLTTPFGSICVLELQFLAYILKILTNSLVDR
jgi:hypothetical protein